jgi:hypothetical protein
MIFESAAGDSDVALGSTLVVDFEVVVVESVLVA